LGFSKPTLAGIPDECQTYLILISGCVGNFKTPPEEEEEKEEHKWMVGYGGGDGVQPGMRYRNQ
jgi:hypothetical protein